MIRVVLPYHLRTLARLDGELALDVPGPATLRSLLETLEARHPALRGTIREHGTLRRRAFVRFYACEDDWSHESPDRELPEAIAAGREPLLIMGAMSGG